MVKKADTWMPFYVADYLADTSRLSTEMHGAYLLLILDYWRNGAPPDDDDILSSITRLPLAKWKKARLMLSAYFQVSDGFWHHKRIEEEIRDANEITNERSRAGKAGAEKRWQKNVNGYGKCIAVPLANGSQNHRQNDAPSPSPLTPPLPSGAPPLEVSKKPKKPRKTQVPDDWQPTDDGMKFALDRGFPLLDAERMAAKFRDHHRARGTVFSDISAGWRTWVQREIDFKKDRREKTGEPEQPTKILRRIEFYERERRKAASEFDDARVRDLGALIAADRAKLEEIKAARDYPFCVRMGP